MSITPSTLSLGQPRHSARKTAAILATLLVATALIVALIVGLGASASSSPAHVERSVPYQPAIHFYGTGAPPVVSAPASAPAPQRLTAYPRPDDFYGAS